MEREIRKQIVNSKYFNTSEKVIDRSLESVKWGCIRAQHRENVLIETGLQSGVGNVHTGCVNIWLFESEGREDSAERNFSVTQLEKESQAELTLMRRIQKINRQSK